MSQPNQQPDEVRRDAANMSEVARSESVRVTEDGITEVGFDDPELRPLPPDKLHYHVPHPDPHPEAHEHSDVPIRPLVIALAAIVVVGAVTHVLLYWVFWRYDTQQRALEIPRTAVTAARPVVPEPRLQGVPGLSDNHPTQDMQQMRARYRAELTSYGKSADGAAARVPIDRAMELALERKLFPVSAAATGKAAGAGQQQQQPQQQQQQPQQQQSPQQQQPSQPQQPQPRSPERERGQQ